MLLKVSISKSGLFWSDIKTEFTLILKSVIFVIIVYDYA
jgi:hypothetical protein